MHNPPYPPETYYRVAVKALIFDKNGRLLLFKDRQSEWEVPGGGMDHAEDYKACLKRELAEESGAKIKSIGPLAFFYRHTTWQGHPKISLAFPVQLESMSVSALGADNLAEARFVSKEEFLQLPLQKSETPIKEYANQIWRLAGAIEKTGQSK